MEDVTLPPISHECVLPLQWRRKRGESAMCSKGQKCEPAMVREPHSIYSTDVVSLFCTHLRSLSG